jgi:hypothetical protein
MKTERWAFSESELANPAACKADDELVGEVPYEYAEENGIECGIIIYRNGEVSNRWEDGTAGVPAEARELADECETLFHPQRNETTDVWADVFVDHDGAWLGWAGAATMWIAATAAPVFLNKTALVTDVLIEAVLAEPIPAMTEVESLTPTQVAWFTAHCDLRFRWFHANKADWRKWLESRNRRIDPRSQCKVWIRHWLAAYRKDPARFEQQKRMCPNCGRPDEWYENRSDGFIWWKCDACGFKSEAEKLVG